jgi:hypothetical protein
MFVRCVVIHNQVNRKILGHRSIDLVQELDEFLMSVPGQASFDDRSRRRVKRGEQCCRSVAAMVVRLTRGHAFCGAAKSARFVRATERRSFRQRSRKSHSSADSYTTDNISQFRDEIGVRAKFEVCYAMRLQIVRPPKAINRAATDMKAIRHLVCCPMRRILRQRLHRRRDNLGDLRFADFSGATAAGSVIVNAFKSALLEAPTKCSRAIFVLRDISAFVNAVRRIQQDQRATHGALRRRRLRHEHHQFTTIRRANVQRWSWRKRHV